MKKRPEKADSRPPGSPGKQFFFGQRLRKMAKKYDREMKKLRALVDKDGPDNDGPDRKAS